MLETIYITRHGFRGSWESAKWTSPTGIDADPPLASHGVDQAKELTKHLLQLDPVPQRIYSSPFYRCLQTIHYVAEAFELPVHVDNGIGEWYGVTRDTHPSPAGIVMLKGFFPEIEDTYKVSLIPSNKGETMADIHARVKVALEYIIADAEKHQVKAIILCTHAATNIALGRALTGHEEMTVNTGTCSLGKYTRTTSSGPWSCELNGDCSFLTEGEERNWWFDGDIPIYDAKKSRLGTKSNTSNAKI